MNRDYDTNVTSNGTRTAVSHYTNSGLPTGAPATVTSPIASRAVHKRVRAGGKFDSSTQKPYLIKSYLLNQVAGALSVDAGDGTFTKVTGVTTGSFRTGSFSDPLFMDAEGFYRGTNRIHLNGPDPGINPDLLSQAEAKALNKLRGRSGEADIDLSVWYGERRETANLFRDAAVGLCSVARALATKNWAQSAKVLRDTFSVKTTAQAEARRMARVERRLRSELGRTPSRVNRTLRGLEDATLTYNLGVSPLISGLKDAHLRLQTGDLTAKTAVKAVAQHSRQIQDIEKVRLGGVDQEQSIVETHGYTVTLVAVPTHDELARLSRWGLTNPASTVHELISLSFLLDYVANFGPYLSALDVPAGFVFYQGSWTHRVVRVITVRTVSRDGTVAKGSSVLNYTKRSVYASFPVPIPPLSLRHKDLNVTQAVNTGVLAVKALRSLTGL